MPIGAVFPLFLLLERRYMLNQAFILKFYRWRAIIRAMRYSSVELEPYFIQTEHDEHINILDITVLSMRFMIKQIFRE